MCDVDEVKVGLDERLQGLLGLAFDDGFAFFPSCDMNRLRRTVASKSAAYGSPLYLKPSINRKRLWRYQRCTWCSSVCQLGLGLGHTWEAFCCVRVPIIFLFAFWRLINEAVGSTDRVADVHMLTGSEPYEDICEKDTTRTHQAHGTNVERSRQINEHILFCLKL